MLIGYLDRQQGPWQSEDKAFTVHGRYRAGALPAILRAYGADLVLFPSAGPETFSYTLSESWSAGLCVLVPPIGALAERVRASGAGQVMTTEEWQHTQAMFARIESLLFGAERALREHAADVARSLTLPAPASMARATLALYDVARQAAGDPLTLHPLDARRVRDALGYVPWQPPPPSAGRTGGATIAARPRRARGDAVASHARGRIPLSAPAASTDRRAEVAAALMAASYDDWISRAREHIAEARPIDALTCYREAARLGPGTAEPLRGMADSLWRLGKTREAVAAWREAVTRQVDDLPSWQALGRGVDLRRRRRAGAGSRRATCARAHPATGSRDSSRHVTGLASPQTRAAAGVALEAIVVSKPRFIRRPHVAGALARALAAIDQDECQRTAPRAGGACGEPAVRSHAGRRSAGCG